MEKQTVAHSGFSSFVAQRPAWRNYCWQDNAVSIVLVKCWKLALWNAKKFLKNYQISKQLLPKFKKLPPKFVDILI